MSELTMTANLISGTNICKARAKFYERKAQACLEPVWADAYSERARAWWDRYKRYKEGKPTLEDEAHIMYVWRL